MSSPSILTEEEQTLVPNPYEALGLSNQDASEKEIRSAYRKMSLKWHPDKNPDNPAAVHQFHLLSLSYAILSDPSKRSYINARLATLAAKNARKEGMEQKRRDGINDLLRREEEVRKMKEEEVKEGGREEEERRVKEEGRRRMKEKAEEKMRQQREQQIQNTVQPQPQLSTTASSSSAPSSMSIPEMTHQDLTLTLQFPSIPDSEVSLRPEWLRSSKELEGYLNARYGPTSFVILRDAGEGKMEDEGDGDGDGGPRKKQKKSKPRGPKAIIEFRKDNWPGCWACWMDHAGAAAQDRREKRGGKPLLPGTKVKFATVGGSGKNGGAEGKLPKWVEWAEKRNGSVAEATSIPPPDTRTDTNHDNAKAKTNTNTITNSHLTPNENTNANTTTNAYTGSSFPSSFPPPPPTHTATTTFSNGHPIMDASTSNNGSGAGRKDQGQEYESTTLFKMRQRQIEREKERERLEDEIRRMEEEE